MVRVSYRYLIVDIVHGLPVGVVVRLPAPIVGLAGMGTGRRGARAPHLDLIRHLEGASEGHGALGRVVWGGGSPYHIFTVGARPVGRTSGHFRGHVSRRHHRAAWVARGSRPGPTGLDGGGHEVRYGLLEVVADLLGVAVGRGGGGGVGIGDGGTTPLSLPKVKGFIRGPGQILKYNVAYYAR